MRTELELRAVYNQDRATVAKLEKEHAAKLAEARKALSALKQELDAELAEAKATLSQSRKDFNEAKGSHERVRRAVEAAYSLSDWEE
jgi:SMC interacting uncharacterized protein involved in chromosome segregation